MRLANPIRFFRYLILPTLMLAMALPIFLASVPLPVNADNSSVVLAQATADSWKGQLDSFGSASNLGGAGKEDSLSDIIGKIIKGFLGLMGVLVVVLIIYAGYLYMTAGGNEKKVDEAKKIIINATIGAVLIFSAYAITNFVIGAIETGTKS